MLLVNGSLAHGRAEDGQARLVHQFVRLFDYKVPNGACIDQNDRIMRFANAVYNLVENDLFDLLVIGWHRDVDGSRKSLAGDILLHQI